MYKKIQILNVPEQAEVDDADWAIFQVSVAVEEVHSKCHTVLALESPRKNALLTFVLPSRNLQVKQSRQKPNRKTPEHFLFIAPL